MSPYREPAGPTATALPCPGCGRPLDDDLGHAPLACAGRCGTWYDAVLLPVPVARLGALDPVKPFGFSVSPRCPRCQVELERRLLGGVPFSVCRTDGVWVALDSTARFESRVDRFAREIAAEEAERSRQHEAQQRAIEELAENMASVEGRRVVAKRIVELEARLEKLEQDHEKLEQDHKK